MSDKYKIVEIFYSLQGEGRWTGTPAVFIRFAGCNLKCPFCDTDFSHGDLMNLDELMKEVLKYPTMHVILTGGEPTLQVDHALLERLHHSGMYIHIETNGTTDIRKKYGQMIDWITVSPKGKYEAKSGHELKVVYVGQTEAELNEYVNTTNFEHYYLQPCSMSNIKEVVELCKRNPKWKVSIQVHKLLKIQ